jgi:hypothetical protein
MLLLSFIDVLVDILSNLSKFITINLIQVAKLKSFFDKNDYSIVNVENYRFRIDVKHCIFVNTN